jgi:RNase P protein component
MGRQRADAGLMALSRQRADSSTEHFGVSMRRHADRPRLGLSIPKRLLPLAVERNALKRVAREAWRLADWPEARALLAMIRLRRRSDAWRAMPRGALKRVWRAELDLLIRRARVRVPS